MKKGDSICVPVVRQAKLAIFGPRHYGIYENNSSVYHFHGSDLQYIYISCTSLDEFADGARVSVDKSVKPKYSADEIIERALSKIGSDFGGYNLATNNCEHFVNWCLTGKRTSTQTPYNQLESKAALIEKLENPESEYYNKPGRIYVHNKSRKERLEDHYLQNAADVVAAPILLGQKVINWFKK